MVKVGASAPSGAGGEVSLSEKESSRAGSAIQKGAGDTGKALIIVVVVAIAIVGYLIYSTVSGITGAFKGVSDGVAGVEKGFSDALGSTESFFGNIGAQTTEAGQTLVQDVTGAGSSLFNAANGAGASAGNEVMNLSGAAQTAFANVGQTLGAAWNSLFGQTTITPIPPKTTYNAIPTPTVSVASSSQAVQGAFQQYGSYATFIGLQNPKTAFAVGTYTG